MASSSDRAKRAEKTSLPGAEKRVASGSQPEPCSAGQRFPRSLRLTARRQYRAVYDQGRRAGCSTMTLFALPSESGRTRLGITVTRRVGCAVVRNRAKRRLRDLFRRHRLRLAPPMDLVVNAHRALLDCPMQQLEQDLLGCFARVSKRRGR